MGGESPSSSHSRLVTCSGYQFFFFLRPYVYFFGSSYMVLYAFPTATLREFLVELPFSRMRVRLISFKAAIRDPLV